MVELWETYNLHAPLQRSQNARQIATRTAPLRRKEPVELSLILSTHTLLLEPRGVI